ncbi:MAG: hypothetical protein ACI9TV_002684 [Sulfurimonas sp.]|uniref:hypothetical protein n=1 Tax=Sulfurimonas sp. TaxID=2022749 RepID=UPI0039E49489
MGFSFGLMGFILLPYFVPEVDLLFRWGILCWYTTLGAIIGVFGVFTYHPILKLPLPWWFRSFYLGAWMNFVLTLFTYDTLQAIMIEVFGKNGLLHSPFWMVLDGAIAGLIIGYFSTKYGGEGKDIV